MEPFRPIIDGTIITGQVLDLFKKGSWQSDKELIIGTNSEEMEFIDSFFEFLEREASLRLYEVSL